jgi:hypothetical protein
LGQSASIGCDEYHAGAQTGPLGVSIAASFTNLSVGFAARFTALIDGRPTSSIWNLGDGLALTNQPYISHAWASAGDYAVVLRAYNESNPGGISATITVHVVAQPVHYVSATSVSPVAPYASWSTAAQSIQDAVNAATLPGALVLVNDGTYVAGGSAAYSQVVLVDKPLTVRSVNGPTSTTINGGGSNQCVVITVLDGATLSGFTLTGGASTYSAEGGGVYGGTLNNCILTGNSASIYGSGSGAAYSTLNNCIVTNNPSGAVFCTLNSCLVASHPGVGANSCTLNNCIVANNAYIGAVYCTLNHCIVTNNSSARGLNPGGAADRCTLNNCIVADNALDGTVYSTLNNCLLTGNADGGAYNSTLNNCTLTGNPGGGASYSRLNNCIVYFNTSTNANNYDSYSALSYCCTTPLPTNGVGNITNAPRFVDYPGGNLRLQSNSPCINAGKNAFAPAGPDLDGNPRIAGGTADIGAYEFQTPSSMISYVWLQHYGLPTDGSADFADPDGDGMKNWQEWRCGTDPTNGLSALRMLAPAPTGTNVTVTWQSIAGINYLLERSTNLGAGFTPLSTYIPGQPGTTTYTDTNAVGPRFYRVGVSAP